MSENHEEIKNQPMAVRVFILEDRMRQAITVIEKQDAKIDKLQMSLDEWSEKLTDAIVKGFDKASERFVPKETWNWWQAFFTKILWGICAFAAAAFASGWRIGH